MISTITKQLCLCLGLLAATHVHTAHSIIEPQENYDLCITMSYQNDGNTVFNHINHTTTQCGSNYLANILTNPTSDIAELTRRQNLLKQLIAQPTVCQQLKEQLDLIAEHEKTLESFWLPEDATTKTALAEFFYESKFLAAYNTNPHALNVGFIAHTANLFMPIAEHAVLHFLISDKLKKKLHIDCCGSHTHNHCHKHHDHGSKKHSHKHGAECKHESTGAAMFYKAYNIAHMAVHMIGIKALISHVYQKMLLAKDIQKKLIGVAKIVSAIKQIEQLVESNQLNFTQKTHLNNFLEDTQHISESLVALFNLLEKNDFKTMGLIPNIGNILAAYTILRGVESEFRPMLQTIAEVDAYLAITTLYNSFNQTNKPYSFASYTTAEHPSIKLSNYWNVLLKDSNVDGFIEIGDAAPNTMIITGPNGSGKSTLLKSIAIPIILGQTITIVPAKQFVFTPFHSICTSMIHLDNMNNGQSLFIAEISRANDIIRQIKTLSNGQFAFVLLDEICKSTAFDKGQAAARSLIKHLGSYAHVLSCCATHFPAIESLEDESPELCRNYTLMRECGTSNKPQYRHTRGFSRSENAFDIIQTTGLDLVWN